MTLGRKAWTAIILPLVILALTVAPSWFMFVLILVGMIAAVIERIADYALAWAVDAAEKMRRRPFTAVDPLDPAFPEDFVAIDVEGLLNFAVGAAEEIRRKLPPVTTAVLKLNLRCARCFKQIKKTLLKVEGVRSISFDGVNDLVTVTSTEDTEVLVELLRGKVEGPIEVVQPKKDKDGGGGGGGRKNWKGGGNGGKEGGDDVGGGDDDGVEESYGGAEEYFGGNRMEYNGVIVPQGIVYHYGPRTPLHPPQMFSDENPNACHVM